MYKRKDGPIVVYHRHHLVIYYHHIFGYPGHMDDSNLKLIYHNGVGINLSNNTLSDIE